MHNQDLTQWQTAMGLYRDLLEIPETERQLHIERQQISVAIRDKLQQLMKGAEVLDADPLQQRLEQLVFRLAAPALSDEEAEAAQTAMLGRQIGGWTVVDSLGRGGTASVFLVERSAVEFQQRGALKLLSLLMLASGGSQRFIREQQFLAQLHHPNIAMLLDGGVAEDGTPFLVTELVEGVHLRDYCQQHALDTRQTIQLLLQLCAAVKHAHGHLILHRDIKPSNVMVTDEGQLKLLDFGIGKLADQAAEGNQTRIFTPRYAAPEQLHGGAITTATDVYGIGMLAKALLLQQAGTADLAAGQTAEYSDRQQHPKISKELELVLAKATHEEPGMRYTSVDSLERDFLNWLENRPVSAVADSTSYRIKKYLRRHRTAVMAAAAIVFSVLLGVLAVLWQANATRIEAEKSQTLASFMIDLFASGDLLSGQGPDTPISELMEIGAERAKIELIKTPAARAEVLRVIGLAQTEFGQYQLAGENLQAALDSTLDPIQHARVLASMGVWAAEDARFEQGIDWMREAVQVLASKLPAQHPDRLEVEIDLINFLLFLGEYQESLDRADQLIDAIGDLNQLTDQDHANVLRSQAMALTQVERYAEAIDNLIMAIQLASSLVPARPALVAAFYNDLGIAYNYSGQTAAATEAFRSSYQIQSEIYGAGHKRTITTGSNLVLMLRSTGQYQDGVELGNELVANSIASFGQVHRSVIISQFALALVLTDMNRGDAAEQQLAMSIQALRELPDLRKELPNHLSWYGEVLIRQAKFDDAINALEEAEFIRDAEFPEEARRYRVAAQRRLVQALAATQQCDQAQEIMTGIAAEVAAGDPNQALAIQIYLLNCEADRTLVNSKYQQILQQHEQQNKPDAGLRAAIKWADAELMGRE